MCQKSWLKRKTFLATDLAETHVGYTIAYIGSLMGGMFAPHHDRKSKDNHSENVGSGDATDDDNIISLTVSYCLSPV